MIAKNKSKPLLILGCQRSGTTLLAAMLGGHSEINMLFESTTKDVFRLIGKKYSGNKALIWRQIRLHQRSSRFGHLINRIINFDWNAKSSHQQIRLFPSSSLSIQDYIDGEASLIIITRNKDEVVNSICNRTGMKKGRAEREFDRAMKEIKPIEKQAFYVDFQDLVDNPIETLTSICNFLELEFESRMLKGSEYNFVYPSESIVKGKFSSPRTQHFNP